VLGTSSLGSLDGSVVTTLCHSSAVVLGVTSFVPLIAILWIVINDFSCGMIVAATNFYQ